MMSGMSSSNPTPGGPKRGTVLRFLSPGPDSSTAQLRAYATVWGLLLPVWVSAQWWTHPDTLRRVLYVLLSVVSVTQVLSALALLRKRR
jgi:preprotein translocase subunit Sec63